MTRRVNIAVVGCGAWGRNYVRNLQALPSARLSWLCDLEGGALHLARELAPGARPTTDLGAVLADPAVQAVVIATDTGRHHPHAVRALAAGKHVLVEKPMATDPVAAQEMVGAARAAGRLLMAGHLMSYHPATAALCALARTGELGALTRIVALRVNPPGRREGAAPLWSLAPHDVSLILEVVGQRPRLLRAWPDARGGVGRVDLHFGGRLAAQIQLELAQPRRERYLAVIGTRRVAVFDDTRTVGKLMLYEAHRRPPWPWGARIGLAPDQGRGSPLDPRGAVLLGIREPTGVAQAIGAEEPLALQCHHFISCVARGARPRTAGEEGLEVVRLLAAAERSLGADAAVDPAAPAGGFAAGPDARPATREEAR